MNTTMNNTDFAAQLLNILKAADETYLADVAQALERGHPILNARYAAEPVKVKATAKKAVAEKKPVKPVTEAVDGAPSAASYRIASAEIDQDTCVGRITKGGEDKRWKPVVYRESQCGKAVSEDGLCKTCASRSEKYEGKPGAWVGRVTEEPLEWVHMLGTEWAEKKKPVFIGSSPSLPSSPSDASEASEASVAEASENESAQEMTEVKKIVTVKAKKAKPTDEEKEAAKAAKAAEKEAAKAAKAAEKEAAKAAKAAEKEAEKAAKAAEKAAKAEKPKPKAKTEKTEKKKAEAKVVETAPVEEVTGEVRLIDDKAYFLRNGNVFHYCELDEEIGSFVGRINDDGTIDMDADEVKAPESETE